VKLDGDDLYNAGLGLQRELKAEVRTLRVLLKDAGLKAAKVEHVTFKDKAARDSVAVMLAFVLVDYGALESALEIEEKLDPGWQGDSGAKRIGKVDPDVSFLVQDMLLLARRHFSGYGLDKQNVKFMWKVDDERRNVNLLIAHVQHGWRPRLP